MKDCEPLYKKLRKNPHGWTEEHTKAVKRIKLKTKILRCLSIPHPKAFKIMKVDAFEVGFGGILMQKIDEKEVLISYSSRAWKPTQKIIY